MLKRHVQGALVVCLALLFFGSVATGESASNQSSAEVIRSTDYLHILQPIPDPEFHSEPMVTISGNSGEFHSVYRPPEGNGGMIELNWTHTAGTELEWNEEPDSELPDCLDFIYASQSFIWDHEVVPQKVLMEFTASVDIAGDFAQTPVGYLMYDVYVWLIDPSGDWVELRRYPSFGSSEPKTEIFLMSEQDIEAGWDGIVSGEDPDGEMTVAIGLAPNSNFDSYVGSHPWQTYNGSISVSFNSVRMICYTWLAEPALDSLEVMFNNSLAIPGQEFFPPEIVDVPESVDVRVRDMTILSDNSIVTIGYCMNLSESGIIRRSIVAKWDASLNLQWYKVMERDLLYSSVNADGLNIYISGRTSFEKDPATVVSVKMNSIGDVIWQRYLNSTEAHLRSPVVAVAPNGTMYLVYGILADNVTAYPNSWSEMLAYSGEGDLLWNTVVKMPAFWNESESYYAWGRPTQLEIALDGRLYLVDFWDTIEIRSPYDMSLIGFCESIDCDSNGTLYSSTSVGAPDDYCLKVAKHNGTIAPGIPSYEWMANFTYRLTSDLGYLFSGPTIRVDSSGMVHVLVFAQPRVGSESLSEVLLLKFGPSGELISNSTITEPHWWIPRGLEVGTNGLAYVGVEEKLGDFNRMGVYAYVVGEYIPPPIDIVPIVLTATAIIGFIAVVEVFRRRRNV